jgi:haloacetate dehalogenase
MAGLGHARFAAVGHDRGARVAYRMAFDAPDAVSRLAVLDILPTWNYWERLDRASGLGIYHWMFLAQPHPLPETLIGGAPGYFLENALKSWTAAHDLSAFDPRALAAYHAQMADPERCRAMCEDYRAGASADVDDDAADRAAGRKIAAPLLALWGSRGIAKGKRSPIEVWNEWASDVRGQAVDCGHFLPEEAPEATLAALLPFLKGG